MLKDLKVQSIYKLDIKLHNEILQEAQKSGWLFVSLDVFCWFSKLGQS